MEHLTPGEEERLIKLNEELAESMERMAALQQAMCKTSQTINKALLHGYCPELPDGTSYNNRSDLERELGDVKAATSLMIDAGDISEENINVYAADKRLKITRYMKHQTP